MQVQNILLLHNERLETIESCPKAAMPSADAVPPLHDSVAEPSSKDAELPVQSHGGHGNGAPQNSTFPQSMRC